MRIIQKSVLTEAASGDTTINAILKYSRTLLQSNFNVVLGSTDEKLRNSYTVVYWNKNHSVPKGDTGTWNKVNDSAVTRNVSSLATKLNDASDDDVFLFLLWQNSYVDNNNVKYTLVTSGAKTGCPFGVILATYRKGQLDTNTNLGCTWIRNIEGSKPKLVNVANTYKESNFKKVAQDCSVVIKLKSGDNGKSGNTVTVKNYLLDKYVKGFNEMLLYAEEIKKNFTNDFKVIYENTQKAFDEIDAKYKANSATLDKDSSNAYKSRLKAINNIVKSLEKFYLALSSDKTATIPREHDYDEGLITEAATNAQNKARRESAKAIMNRIKNSNNYEASGTNAAAKKQGEANVAQKINQVKANEINQAEDKAEELVFKAHALTELPDFIARCVRVWKRINLYYNREATIRTVASNDPSILLEYENIFNQFPSEKLYIAEQALEKLYNDLYKSNGVMGHLRELYKISKSDNFKTIYITIDGNRRKLSDIKLSADDTDLGKISEIMDQTLKAYIDQIDKIDVLDQLSISLNLLKDTYFESGKPLSNEYFEAHNKILKDIEERIAKRIGTTATIKSVDATNVSVHNQ